MKVHAFFPGSFSPFHDGHFELIRYFLEKFKDDFILEICVSNKCRDDIPSNIKIDFIKQIFDNYTNVLITECDNPIKYVYENTNDKNVSYILISGNKDNDNRSELYEKYFNKSGYIILNENFIQYKLDNKVVSARYLRDFIKDNNYIEFVKYYKNIITNSFIKDKEVKKLFEKLKSFKKFKD